MKKTIWQPLVLGVALGLLAGISMVFGLSFLVSSSEASNVIGFQMVLFTLSAVLRGLLAGAITSTISEIGTGLANAATTLDNTSRLSGELESTLARTAGSVAALEETARSVTRTSRALEAAVGEGREGVAKVFGQLGPEVTALLGEMRQLAETLRRVARDVETNPRVFLFGRQRGEPGPGE